MNSKHFLIFLILTFLLISKGNAQEIYSSTKGTRLFPGHLHMIITKKNDSIRYELFNHWYSRSYSLLRDISVSVAQLPIQSDSVGIHDMGNKFLVKDKKNGLDKMAMGGLNRSCYSINFMRNMSFAYSLSLKYKIGHHAFYDEIDWEQSQDAFQNLYMELVNDSLHIPASPPN